MRPPSGARYYVGGIGLPQVRFCQHDSLHLRDRRSRFGLLLAGAVRAARDGLGVFASIRSITSRAESVGQPRDPPLRHADRQVLPLRVARADQVQVRRPLYDDPAPPRCTGRGCTAGAVATLVAASPVARWRRHGRRGGVRLEPEARRRPHTARSGRILGIKVELFDNLYPNVGATITGSQLKGRVFRLIYYRDGKPRHTEDAADC